MSVTNPNGANQWTPDPRQKACWDYYINPQSDTFSNAYQSAMKAGYEETTASQMTIKGWFMEKVRRIGMLDKAEIVLKKTLDDVEKDPKLAQDSAKFLAKTLGKDFYSERQEIEMSGKMALISQNDVKTRLNNLKRK